MNTRTAVTTLIAVAALFTLTVASAEDENAAEKEQWRKELKEDHQAIQEQKEELKSNSESARAEESALRSQIDDAIKAGDKDKAKELKAQLKNMHHENVGEKQSDKKELNQLKKELKSDKHEAHKSWMDKNHDGTVDRAEHHKAQESHHGGKK